eukprot:1835-Heterococcus_DN1.PRE.1
MHDRYLTISSVAIINLHRVTYCSVNSCVLDDNSLRAALHPVHQDATIALTSAPPRPSYFLTTTNVTNTSCKSLLERNHKQELADLQHLGQSQGSRSPFKLSRDIATLSFGSGADASSAWDDFSLKFETALMGMGLEG